MCDDSPVRLQAPIQLTAANVEGVHRPRPLPEQTVGESPGRSPEVRADAVFHADSEVAERSLQLGAAPAHEAPLSEDSQARLLRHKVAGLVDLLIVGQDIACKDHRLGFLAAGREFPLDQQKIDTLLHGKPCE